MTKLAEWSLSFEHGWRHLFQNRCILSSTLDLTEISPRVEGKVQAFTRRIRHKLGVFGQPNLKSLRWTGPVYRDNGSAIYIRIFDNQITPPCDVWREELKLYNYVVTPVVTVEDHHDYVVLANRSEYRIYQCGVCTGAFHVAKTWMWRPIWVEA